jgi:hypothetical protein
VLLGALAAAQRRELILADPGDLRRSVVHCASSLTQARLRLPLPELDRIMLEQCRWLQPRPKECASEKGPSPNKPARQRSNMPREGSLRRRAVDVASGKPVITARELRALAISRQHLSHLCARGLFERIAPGQYRLVRKPAA